METRSPKDELLSQNSDECIVSYQMGMLRGKLIVE